MEPPSAVLQVLIKKCLPNIGHIHDQEGEAWILEPTIAALQHVLVSWEGEYPVSRIH